MAVKSLWLRHRPLSLTCTRFSFLGWGRVSSFLYIAVFLSKAKAAYLHSADDADRPLNLRNLANCAKMFLASRCWPMSCQRGVRVVWVFQHRHDPLYSLDLLFLGLSTLVKGEKVSPVNPPEFANLESWKSTLSNPPQHGTIAHFQVLRRFL